ncbi:hypothetical protein BIY21_05385 [Vibrio ponticus]|uniref:Type VI secretion system-associated FHA domain protein TagH n=1 Tax=Vibrio ponticus TaxID=265668 RepID=A0ABX3F3E3_9VIBR|nr:type VI secretion system-associated FHA domain protein TagH [Vibrio ponticus]OLQ84319.1 hypothetical protein BIY21_05385 [Vibrio ponticus]
MKTTSLPVLTLVVTNAQRLESGLSVQHSFYHDGGKIGSSPLADWQLKAPSEEVYSQHCEIVVVDGAYCLKDLSGFTYVNGAQLPIGKGCLAKLREQDEIQLGPYQLRVLFDKSHANDPHLATLNNLFFATDNDLINGTGAESIDEVDEEDTDAEPLNALDGLMSDPLSLEAESNVDQTVHENSLIPKNESELQSETPTLDTDSEQDVTSSIRLKKILGFGFWKSKQAAPENKGACQPMVTAPITPALTTNAHSDQKELGDIRMDEKDLDLLEQEMARGFQSSNDFHAEPEGRSNHLVTGPVLDGLGVDLSDEDDMTRMHVLSQEMGESLQACVRGLLELHQQVSEGRFGTLNRNLQPIEDNPLRLGLSYDETIRTLYDADKSLVHLSAPAAITESLKTIRDHNEAMQHATSEALTQVLNAFDPETMLRRFQHYKRRYDTSQTTTEGWAWHMYCNYYKELTSSRQRGFEKLFWEIFEQSYDRKLREKQKEL